MFGMTELRLTQLLVILAGCVLAFSFNGPSTALAQQAGDDQLFALTAPGQAPGQTILFVIDPQTTRLAVYEYRSRGQLEVRAVRNMQFDLAFEQWPAVKAKRQLPAVEDMKP
jgi:hypothetical protein